MTLPRLCLTHGNLSWIDYFISRRLMIEFETGAVQELLSSGWVRFVANTAIGTHSESVRSF